VYLTVGNFGNESDGSGIDGVSIRAFEAIDDFRGGLAEIHRDDWKLAPRPVQWDLLHSKADVLRGVHVHRLRWDYIIVLEGQGTIGLKDIRRDRRSFGRNMVIEVTGDHPTVVTIPPGVAHGILANTSMRHLYGLTVAWDGHDEDLGCRYDDPALGIAWQSATPLLLPRDLELPDFATLLRQFEAALVSGAGPAIPPP
jgi:dTDP-4-dehydrorhamnose 3,5-epimerase